MTSRLVLCVFFVAATLATPLMAVAEGSPGPARQATLLCDVSTVDGGLVVAAYVDNTGTGIGGEMPQPGDRCLPFLAASLANGQPFKAGGTEATAVRLTGTNPQTLFYTTSRGGKPVQVIGCEMEAGTGKLLTSFASAVVAGSEVAIGQPCLDEIGKHVANSGLDLTGPLAATLGGAAQDGSGVFWILNQAFKSEAKAIRCDTTAAGFTVTSYEGPEGVDSSYVGQPCLAVVNQEKENGYTITNPTAPPEIEECLIFDLSGSTLMTARALPQDPPPPPPPSN
jgi:hypothetical protein